MKLSLDRPTTTALLVAAVFFMENLDATVIGTALPAMARDFGTAAAHLSIGVSAYLVALTVFIPISGWMANRCGARNVFSVAIVVFTLASLLCAMSSSLGEFTGARTLQGIGGAMMVPVGRLVVLRNTPKEKVVHAIAILTWPALLAPILGPVTGGWISTHWSWHWIFFLNLPLGAFALLGAWVLVDNEGIQRAPFDMSGFLLTGLGFGLFMAGLEAASRTDISRALTFAMLAIGITLLLISSRHLTRAAHPLFGLEPLAIPTFRVTAVGGSLFRTAVNTAPFLLPLMLQLSFGYNAVEAGALLLWLFAGNLAMKPATTRVISEFGFRRVLIVNGVLVVISFAAFSLLTADTPHWGACVLLFLSGMARSMQFTALNTVGFADIPQPQMSSATTLFSVLQQMNAGMGIAFGALALSIAQIVHGTPGNTPSTSDFHLAFAMIAAVAAIAVIDSTMLARDAGARVLARQR